MDCPDDSRSADTGTTENRWYYFVPLALWGSLLWLGAGHLTLLAFSVAGSIDAPLALTAVLAEAEFWLLLSASLSMLVLHCVIASRKSASGWWLLGAFICGVNVLVYVILLFKRAPRRALEAEQAAAGAYFPASSLPAVGSSRRIVPKRFGATFVCVGCDTLLNHGVSECSECGERYRYVEGEPATLDDEP